VLYVQHYYTLILLFTATATTEIYTLSLHDALPISLVEGTRCAASRHPHACAGASRRESAARTPFGNRAHPSNPSNACASGISSGDRKSTRLNSSHVKISYAVFCLKKKKSKKCRSTD